MCMDSDNFEVRDPLWYAHKMQALKVTRKLDTDDDMLMKNHS